MWKRRRLTESRDGKGTVVGFPDVPGAGGEQPRMAIPYDDGPAGFQGSGRERAHRLSGSCTLASKECRTDSARAVRAHRFDHRTDRLHDDVRRVAHDVVSSIRDDSLTGLS